MIGALLVTANGESGEINRSNEWPRSLQTGILATYLIPPWDHSRKIMSSRHLRQVGLHYYNIIDSGTVVKPVKILL